MLDSSTSKNVDRIELDGKVVHLVGTAHLSKVSVDQAEEVIRTVKPDSVAVELCDSRYQSLKDPNRWRNTDILSVIRSKKTSTLLAQLILAGFQKKLGSKLDIKPGAEMMRAIAVAEELGINVVLADRDIRTTLKRTWSSLNFWSTFKLIGAMIGSLFVKSEITPEEIERLKSADALESMMQELSDAIPGVHTALIDERDKYLATKIAQAPGKNIVAIIGAGHVPGIKRYITTPQNLAPLEVIPQPKLRTKIMAWSIPAIIVGMMIYGCFFSGKDMSYEMMKTWAIATGVCAGLGAASALAHPITIISAVIAAPFTALHPFLAAGMVSGLVEAILRRPLVADLESIAEDMTTVRGLWRNRLSKILLIVAFTNIGGTIGIFLGGFGVASYL